MNIARNITSAWLPSNGFCGHLHFMAPFIGTRFNVIDYAGGFIISFDNVFPGDEDEPDDGTIHRMRVNITFTLSGSVHQRYTSHVGMTLVHHGEGGDDGYRVHISKKASWIGAEVEHQQDLF